MTAVRPAQLKTTSSTTSLTISGWSCFSLQFIWDCAICSRAMLNCSPLGHALNGTLSILFLVSPRNLARTIKLKNIPVFVVKHHVNKKMSQYFSCSILLHRIGNTHFIIDKWLYLNYNNKFNYLSNFYWYFCFHWSIQFWWSIKLCPHF